MKCTVTVYNVKKKKISAKSAVPFCTHVNDRLTPVQGCGCYINILDNYCETCCHTIVCVYRTEWPGGWFSN